MCVAYNLGLKTILCQNKMKGFHSKARGKRPVYYSTMDLCLAPVPFNIAIRSSNIADLAMEKPLDGLWKQSRENYPS